MAEALEQRRRDATLEHAKVTTYFSNRAQAKKKHMADTTHVARSFSNTLD